MPAASRRAKRTDVVLLVALAYSACAGPSAEHPLAGRLRLGKGETGYAIYSAGDWLYVRVSSGDKPHRFQGSITAIKGALGPLELERPALADQIASAGASVHFDVDVPRAVGEGFRVRLDDKACLRFDLYVDGAHRPERVHLGGHRATPRNIPFERCP